MRSHYPRFRTGSGPGLVPTLGSDGGTTEVANFCSNGAAYVFVDRAQPAQPVYSMFINR